MIMPSQQNFTAQIQGVSPIALLGGIGRSWQAIAAEMTIMSQENLEAGSKAMEKLTEVKSLPDALAVQSELAKAAFETIGAHGPRIAQIAASTPAEIVRGYQEAFGRMAEASGDAVQNASDATRSVIAQTKSAARGAMDKAEETVRSTTR
jgi:hypothetical protein